MRRHSLAPAGIITFRRPPSSSSTSGSDDENSPSEEESGSSDSAKRHSRRFDQTWRWGIWQSRDARRAATSYTDSLLSQMPESFRFQTEVLDRRNIVLGAKLLLALNFVAFSLSYVVIALLLAAYHRPGQCDETCAIDHGCGLFYLLVEVNGGAVRVIVDFLYLLVVLPILIYCLFWKTEREKDANLRRRVYLVTLSIIYVKVWLMYMYPVGLHCSLAERALSCGGIGRKDQVLDFIPECRSFGFFLLNKDMGLVMLSPAVVPECSKMRGFLWSLTGLYYVAAMLAIHQLVKTPNQRYHAYFDVIIGLVFLFLVNEAARHRKWYMERADQVSFVLALRQKKASQSMFQILTFMLPSFMVTRILRNPDSTISEHVERASILFIKINDFDSMLQRLSPSDLLERLNSIFSRLDSYCSSRNVTKIETVGEEYMCAVGIVPSDRDEEEELGHRTLLRLVQLAGDVLDYSKSTAAGDQVIFQMGIHTGPLIAGVVGSKLPRFRLFGDTVNTAARMMQKGLPNEVQFGEETRRELPVGVAYRRRGPVEMKGKGVINTYLLVHHSSGGRRISFKSPRRLNVHGTVQLAAAVVQSGGGSAVWEGPPEEETEMFEDAVVDAEHQSGRRWSDWLDCKRRGEAAQQFRAWYYENHLFRKLVKRLDKFLIFIVVLTFIETIYLADSLGRSSQSPAWHPFGTGKWHDEQCPFLRAMSVELVSGDFEIGIQNCQKQCWAYGPCTAIEFNHISGTCTLRQCPEERPPRIAVNDSSTHCFWWSPNLTTDVTDTEAVVTWDMPTRKRKLAKFILSRAVAFGIIFMWRLIVSCTNCVTAHARLLEWATAISCCILSCVLFLSYEVMPEQFTTDKARPEIHEVIPFDFPVSGVSRNITRLVAFPVYMMTITAFPFRFFPCCIFLLGALAIISIESGVITIESGDPSGDAASAGFYMLPTYGDLWYFACFNLLRQFYAYQEEKLLRQQHANGRAVQSVMQRVQSILDTMMPAQVVKEIAEHPDAPLPSHKYQMATIVQSDLVGFTEMSSQRHPEEVVAVIEEIFNMFDDLTDRFGVYKIETVGDAYIAGMAEPPLTAKHSNVTVLRFALAMVEKTDSWSRRRGEEVRLRVGVHTGECVGGVVGKDMQRYHLFGSLSSVLDILESTSAPGWVQISAACFEAMQHEFGTNWSERATETLNCRIVPRAEDPLRSSKGEVHSLSEVGGMTYFLLPSRRLHTH